MIDLKTVKDGELLCGISKRHGIENKVFFEFEKVATDTLFLCHTIVFYMLEHPVFYNNMDESILNFDDIRYATEEEKEYFYTSFEKIKDICQHLNNRRIMDRQNKIYKLTNEIAK